MFVGLTWHVVLATGLLLGVGTLIIWVGVFVLALTLLAWRGGAWLERRWVRAMLGVHIPDPYRPLPAGSLWRRARVLAADPATWKDLAYLVVLFPLGLIWFVVTTTLWTLALGMLTAPLWFWIPADGGMALFNDGVRANLVIDTLPEAILAGVAGAALCVAAAWAVKGMAAAHGAVAAGPARPQPEPAPGQGRGPPGEPRPGGRLGRGRAPPDRARPARRRPAAAGRPGHGPGHGQGQAGDRPGGRHRPGRRGPRGGQAGPGRAARPGPRHPPGRARRPGPRRGHLRPGRPLARPGRGRRVHRPPARPGRVGRLLRGRRGPDQRGQARPGGRDRGPHRPPPATCSSSR